MSDTFSKVEVITGVARRRRFTTEQKLAIVAETMQPGMSISYVARQHGLSPSLVFRCRRLMSEGGKEAAGPTMMWSRHPRFAGSRNACGNPSGSWGTRPWRSRSSRRRSTWRGQKNDLAVALAGAGRFPVKTIAATLGVARSNLIERKDGARPRRGPQPRMGDIELAADVRRLVDARPTYGYRRIAALLKRERRSAGAASVNAKRVYRLMKKHGLLLHTGRRRPRGHGGEVATLCSNIRWCSDALEFTCWNGEIVRIAFALDCHDREAIGWTATTAGISGEMIRDMMVYCVEKRFGTAPAASGAVALR